jgi:methylmalonyl-CoA mutase cobalamin-binding domain/chain
MNKDILSEISKAIVSMDEISTLSLCRQAVEERYPVRTILDNGLLHGMELVSAKYETGEYFVPELLLCSDALNAGLEVIKPLLGKNTGDRMGHIVLGVIAGDAHDIGKGIVRILLEGAGFTVTDLGRDVAYADFVDAAVEKDADIIGISSLITTAMTGMADVINILEKRGLRERFKVIIGGAPTSPRFAEKIGADGYAPNAPAAIELVRSLLPEKEND